MPEDFARLLAAVPEYWRPLVEFLVASGCRRGEATGHQIASCDGAMEKTATVPLRPLVMYTSPLMPTAMPKGTG